MEIVLILIVSACIIGLILISKKQKELDRKEEDKKEEDKKNESDSNKHEEEPSGPPQITIYEFSTKSVMQRCPFCDAENSVGAKVCNICLQDL